MSKQSLALAYAMKRRAKLGAPTQPEDESIEELPEELGLIEESDAPGLVEDSEPKQQSVLERIMSKRL